MADDNWCCRLVAKLQLRTFDIPMFVKLSYGRHAVFSLAAGPIGGRHSVIPMLFNFGTGIANTNTCSSLLARQSPLLYHHRQSTSSRRETEGKHITMSFRPGARIFSSFRPFFRPSQADARRRASTAAGPGGFAGFWNSPIGPKTVHFWCV